MNGPAVAKCHSRPVKRIMAKSHPELAEGSFQAFPDQNSPLCQLGGSLRHFSILLEPFPGHRNGGRQLRQFHRLDQGALDGQIRGFFDEVRIAEGGHDEQQQTQPEQALLF